MNYDPNLNPKTVTGQIVDPDHSLIERPSGLNHVVVLIRMIRVQGDAKGKIWMINASKSFGKPRIVKEASVGEYVNSGIR